MLKLVLVLSVIILISGCSYIQQFREAPLGEEEPFISIIPEDDITEPIVNEQDVNEEETSEITEAETIGAAEESAEPTVKLEVNEGELVKLKLAAVDPDRDPLTYKFSKPLNEKGEWQTKIGDAGDYNVNIIVDDGKISTEQDILIVVKAVNMAPVLEIEKEITVDEGEQIKLQPKVSDPDNDKVTIKYSGWMNSATYTTTYEDAGVYTVTVTVSDGKKEVSQNIKVIVNDMNRPPVIESITLE